MKEEHLLNYQITPPTLRVNYETEGVKKSEVLSNYHAKQLAKNMELDLVLINDKSTPPVCIIVDYGKYLYQIKMKKKEDKKKLIIQDVKELRLTPATSEHDLEFKIKNAKEWLLKGDKVKATVFFKGRQIVYKNDGEILLLKLADTLKDISKAESLPILNGKKMTITLAPNKK